MKKLVFLVAVYVGRRRRDAGLFLRPSRLRAVEHGASQPTL